MDYSLVEAVVAIAGSDRTSVAVVAIVDSDRTLAAEQLQCAEVVVAVVDPGHHNNIFCTNSNNQNIIPSDTSNSHNLE